MLTPVADGIRNSLTLTNGTDAFHFYETDDGYYQADSRGNRRQFDTLENIIAHCEMYETMGWYTPQHNVFELGNAAYAAA